MINRWNKGEKTGINSESKGGKLRFPQFDGHQYKGNLPEEVFDAKAITYHLINRCMQLPGNIFPYVLIMNKCRFWENTVILITCKKT